MDPHSRMNRYTFTPPTTTPRKIMLVVQRTEYPGGQTVQPQSQIGSGHNRQHQQDADGAQETRLRQQCQAILGGSLHALGLLFHALGEFALVIWRIGS